MTQLRLNWCIFLYSFFATLFVHAQSKQCTVMVAPFFTSAPGTWGYGAAFQYAIKKRWAIVGEAGFAPPDKRIKNRFDNYRYVRLAAEVKWYVFNAEDAGIYVSLYNGYIYRRFVRQNEAYVLRRNTPAAAELRFDRAAVHSPIVLNVLRWGYEIRPGKLLTIESYAGIGVRNFFTRYSGVTNPQPTGPNPGKFAFSDPAYEYDETLSRPAFNIGMRVGWRL